MREIKVSGIGPKEQVVVINETEGSIKLVYKVDSKLTIEVSAGTFANYAGSDAREALDKLESVVAEYNKRQREAK